MSSGAEVEGEGGGRVVDLCLEADDPRVADYSLSAAEVMQRLGIKRSRLRELSGTELSVARVQSGRYVKPFYRPEDVDRFQGGRLARPDRRYGEQRGGEVASSPPEPVVALLEEMVARLRALAPERGVELGACLRESTRQFTARLEQLRQDALRLARQQCSEMTQTRASAAGFYESHETSLRALKATVLATESQVALASAQLASLQRGAEVLAAKIEAWDQRVLETSGPRRRQARRCFMSPPDSLAATCAGVVRPVRYCRPRRFWGA